MADVLIKATPTEIPKGSGTSVTIQNQSSTHALRVASAASAPAATASSAKLAPGEWIRITPGSDTIYGWFEGEPTSHEGRVFYEQVS